MAIFQLFCSENNSLDTIFSKSGQQKYSVNIIHEYYLLNLNKFNCYFVVSKNESFFISNKTYSYWKWES